MKVKTQQLNLFFFSPVIRAQKRHLYLKWMVSVFGVYTEYKVFIAILVFCDILAIIEITYQG